ncbi:response regulator transcription factor [Amorphus sp. 3PC139-8]|uniref:response regulator transcription factor n=1 Tax=Amorphus sp. 3PC139-8 TaxID=2735676 RepID=UPI00345D7785
MISQNVQSGGGARILVVEDDPEIGSMLVEALASAGMQPDLARSGVEMDARMGLREFDLIILDVMLPGEDGLSICRRLRAHLTVPIILLTALGEEVDRIVGIEIGADDYITKPFSTRETVARVRGLLRRASYGTSGADRRTALRFDGWRIDPVRRLVFDPASTRIAMTSAEFDLLYVFCQNPGRILSREELLRHTHAGLAGPIERSIDVHISRIRQKIEANPREPVFLKTVRLGGYLFTAIVEPA